MFEFFWIGNLDCEKFHLFAWEVLSKPNNKGGWGIKNLLWFNRALCEKRFWRSLFNTTLWVEIIKVKYLKWMSLDYWFRNYRLKQLNASTI